MPDMDGYTVLARLGAKILTQQLFLSFLTGSNTQTDVRKGMELGADDYLTKPSSIEDLLRSDRCPIRKASFFEVLVRY